MRAFSIQRVESILQPRAGGSSAPGAGSWRWWQAAILAVAAAVGAAGSASAAGSFSFAKVHDFGQPGRTPLGNLVQGADGALYGVGSADAITRTGLGVVFRLNLDGSAFTELRRFTGENGDGALPRSGLTVAGDGALFGVTPQGGDTSDPNRPLGKGVVYRLNPDGSGFTVLRTFRGYPNDGSEPTAALLLGSDGMLYGTTAGGGAHDGGTVFRLNRDGSGYTVLRSFESATGFQLWTGVIQGSDGVLYGTAVSGGAQSGGTLYRLNRDGTGFAVLKHFSEQTGTVPRGPLVEGRDGALYGTAERYGPTVFAQGTVVTGAGTVFKINRDGSGFALLKTFARTTDCNTPQAGLIQHRDGTLLGTLAVGGPDNAGGVFRLNPDGTGFDLVKTFSRSDGDGAGPTSGLMLARNGLYYGSTAAGGGIANANYGVVFSLVPIPASRLANLSVRSIAGTENETLAAGFVLSPTPGKTLLIRGIGPTLGAFGVPGTLGDPVLELFSSAGLHSTNDDWGQAANAQQIAGATQQLSAFALGAGSRDAVLLPQLPGGPYTVQVAGKNNATGVAMIEIYDAAAATGGRLINVSARSRVGTDDNILIAGFIVGGTDSLRLLIRGVGPTLTAFGVEGALADPQLALYRGSALVRQNDNWGGAAEVSAAAAAAGAFPLPAGSRDAALVVTLEPGAYTAQVSGVNATTGVGLVEVYEVDEASGLGAATTYVLTVTKAGSGNGEVTVSPAASSYAAGAIVTLTAAPASGSTFAGWSGDGSGPTTRTVTMDGNKSVTATFNLAPIQTTYTLTTATAGAGRGTIQASPAGPTYPAGSVVTLTAMPAADSNFSAWSGDGSGATTRTVTMDGNKSVTATFALLPTPSTFSLTTATTGTGQGAIQANPAGPSYPAGTVVVLSATPANGSSFAGWSGDGSGTTTRSVTMDSNKSVMATFNLVAPPASYTLTVSTGGTGTGAVTANPAGSTFPAGTVVTLTATPGAGSAFTNWSGDASGPAATTSVTMNANKNVGATFTLIPVSTGAASALRVLPGQVITGSYDPYRRNSVVNGGTLMADGGVPRGGYTWSVANLSALPAGVGLSADGILASNGGTVLPGNYAFSVTVADGTSTATGTITFRVSTEDTTPVGGVPGVQGSAVFSQLLTGSFTLVAGRSGQGYGASLYAIFGSGTAIAATTPLTWTLAAGSSLPAGLTLDQARGVVWGTPATAGTYSFSVVVRSRTGDAAVGAPTYVIRVDP
jgi:uncharacterized repeat protein (TIGR03803 family)